MGGLAIGDDHDLRRWFPAEPATMDYLVNMSPRFGYLYVETPKVACSYLKHLLQIAELEDTGQEPSDNPHDKASSPLVSPSDNMRMFEDVMSGRGPRLTFVRNPFTRALSAYLDKFEKTESERLRLSPVLGLSSDKVPSFDEYLTAVRDQPQGWRDIHWETQSFLLNARSINYSFIGRFETLSSDVAKMNRLLGFTAATALGAQHATGANTLIASYYTPGSISLVKEIYREDFLSFGYGFDIQWI